MATNVKIFGDDGQYDNAKIIQNLCCRLQLNISAFYYVYEIQSGEFILNISLVYRAIPKARKNIPYFFRKAIVKNLLLITLLPVGLVACGGGASGELLNGEEPNRVGEVEDPITIAQLNAFPTVIEPGGSSKLNWQVFNTEESTEITINPSNTTVSAEGDLTVSPMATTIYTLTAGAVSETVTVKVEEADNDGITVVYKPARLAPGVSEIEYKVAVLMVDTTGRGLQPTSNNWDLDEYSAQELCDLYFDHSHGPNSYVIEATYEKIELSGACFGWANKTIFNEDGYVEIGRGTVTTHMDEIIATFKDVMDFDEYDIYVLNVIGDGVGTNTGWLMANGFEVDGIKYKNKGFNFMVNSQIFPNVPGALENTKSSSADNMVPNTSWSHELTHTLGAIAHANSFDCDQDVLCSEVGDREIIYDTINKGYGNPFSIMGSHAYSTHPDVYVKSYLGWIEDSQLKTVTSTSTHTIYPMAANDGKVKGLKIALPQNVSGSGGDSNFFFDTLYIEYRDAIGLDSWMNRLDPLENGDVHPFTSNFKPEGTTPRDGVLLLLRDSRDDSKNLTTTALLDMHPTTSTNMGRSIKYPGNPGKFADATLNTGESYTFPGNLTIRTIGLTADGGVEVEVSF